MNNDELIQSLKEGLTAVGTPLPIGRVAVLWLLLSSAYVLTLGAALGPFRAGFADQLVGSARFALEMLMGFGAAACFLHAALAESVPGTDSRWSRWSGWALSIGWLSQFLVGFEFPAIDPSMHGKRELCAWEAYLYSVPPLLALVWLQRKRFMLEPVRAIFHGALAAGLIPALMMQIACMYEPGHILKFHVLPVGILATAALVLTALITRRAGWLSRGARRR